MKKTFSKTEIVRNYAKKFTKTPSRSLARKIFNEHTEHFKDLEEIRDTLRRIRGVKGVKDNIQKDITLHIKPFTFANPYKLPKSYAEKPKVFTFPKECNNILVLSDLHIPFHDITALTIAIKYGIEKQINTIFINGDLLDFYQISRFVNVERKRSVPQELKAAKAVLQVLVDNFPMTPIYYLKGNHCMRLEHYLAVKAPELLDMEEFKLEVLLEAHKYNMRVFDDTTLMKLGKLNASHGHLVLKGIFAPVNAARGAFLKAKASTIISHVHKVSTHSETTITGKNITCYSTGCLCELSPRYAPFGNNYSLGFAHVIIRPGGMFRVKNMQIINGEIVS